MSIKRRVERLEEAQAVGGLEIVCVDIERPEEESQRAIAEAEARVGPNGTLIIVRGIDPDSGGEDTE